MADLERLKQELAAPIESIRIFALEEIIKSGGDLSLLKFLQDYQQTESDEECLLLVSYAISKIECSIESVSSSVTQPARDNFWSIFSQSSDLEKLRLLNELSRKDCKELGKKCLAIVKTEKHPAVLRRLILSVCIFSEENEFEVFKSFLSFPAVGVRIAALHFLIQKAPDAILKFLPKLLRNSDANLRALAVRGLAKLDATTAVKYFDHFLFNGNELEKRAILASSVFFDFSLIKESLLKLIMQETGIEWLTSTSLLLINNPEMDIIQKLWLYCEKCPESKKPFVSAIIGECLKQLQLSRGSTEDGTNYCETFESWKKNIKITRKVVADTNDLIASDFSDQELIAGIVADLIDPEYQKAFMRMASLNSDQKIKTRLNELIVASKTKGISGKAVSPKPLSVPEIPLQTKSDLPADFSRLSSDKKAIAILSLPAELVGRDREKIKSIFLQSLTEKPVILSLLKLFKRCGSTEFVELGKKAFKHDEPSVVAASIEFLAQVDPDWFFSVAGKLIKHENNLIKRSAIKALREISFDRAMAALKMMLKTRNKKQISDALICMIYFDFNLIRDMVKNIAIDTGDEEIFGSAMILYQNNPEVENLYDLYFLEHKGRSEVLKARAAEVRRTTTDFLVKIASLESGGLQKLEAEFAKRLADYEKDCARAREFYGLDNTIELSPLKQFLFFVKDSLTDLKHQSFDQIARLILARARQPKYLAALAFAALLIWYTGIYSGKDSTLPVKGSSVASETIIVGGKVEQVSPKRLVLRSNSGTIFILKPMRGEFSSRAKLNETVVLKVKPIRRTSKNEIVAVCLD